MHSDVPSPAPAYAANRVYLPARPLDPEFDEPFFFRARVPARPHAT